MTPGWYHAAKRGRYGHASYPAAMGRHHRRLAGGVGCDRPHPGAERALGAAPPRQSRHRRTQHPPEAAHPAVQAHQAPGADRPPGVRSRGAARGRRVRAGKRRAARSGDGEGEALRRGNRALVQRLCLFPRRHPHREKHLKDALPRPHRLSQRRCARRGRSVILSHLRHQSSLQHGLRAGDLCRGDVVGAELRGGRVGAGLGAARPDPLDGRLFHQPRFPRGALSQGAGALRAHGDVGGRDAGDLPRRRPQPRRQTAPAEIRAAQLHGCMPSIRSARATSCSFRSRSITTACWKIACSPRSPMPSRARSRCSASTQKCSRSHFFRHVWMAMRGEWHRFGYTCVSFGEPVSLRKHVD